MSQRFKVLLVLLVCAVLLTLAQTYAVQLQQTPVPVMQAGPVTVVPQSNLQVYLSFATTTITAIIGFLVWYIGAKQTAANKLQAVSNQVNADTNTRVEKKVDEVHTFTDGALGASKRSLAVALRVIADHFQTPGAIKAAESAELDANSHDDSKRIVDAQKLAEAKSLQPG
jgi:hypothetical protein